MLPTSYQTSSVFISLHFLFQLSETQSPPKASLFRTTRSQSTHCQPTLRPELESNHSTTLFVTPIFYPTPTYSSMDTPSPQSPYGGWAMSSTAVSLPPFLAPSSLPPTSFYKSILNVIFNYFHFTYKNLGWYSKFFSKILKGVDLASTRTSIGHTIFLDKWWIKNTIYNITKIYFYTSIIQIDVKTYFFKKWYYKAILDKLSWFYGNLAPKMMFSNSFN